jgi:hypothetical protein
MRMLALLLALTSVPAVYGAELLWPLPASQTITGGFADSRPDHFHGGVDVHTGSEPQVVIAPADGWIERIAVTPPGYGHALYFRLADGRTAVFGHLSRFTPVLEQMLRDSQLACGTYRVDFSFAESIPQLCFHAGDTLAFSGKSGVGPAHLHYEIREGDVQTDPLAPYQRVDHDPPVVTNISWITLSDFTPWSSGKTLPLKRIRAGYWTASAINAAEPVAFFIRCYDPNPWGRNAVPKSIRVKVDGRTLYEDQATRIILLGSRDIYAKIVWPERQRRRDVRRLFDIPPRSEYRDSIDVYHGWLANLDRAAVVIEVEDRAGNIAQVKLAVTAGTNTPSVNPQIPPAIQSGSFTLETAGDPSAAWAELTALSADEVRISPASLAFGKRLRLLHNDQRALPGTFCYERNTAGSLRTISQAQLDPDSLSNCWILRAGTYGVGQDSLPPELSLSVRGGKLHFRLTDDLSGIDDAAVRAAIDGQTAIPEFEYEERGGMIWTPKPLISGAHDVVFTAADRAGNTRRWQSEIVMP